MRQAQAEQRSQGADVRRPKPDSEQAWQLRTQRRRVTIDSMLGVTLADAGAMRSGRQACDRFVSVFVGCLAGCSAALGCGCGAGKCDVYESRCPATTNLSDACAAGECSIDGTPFTATLAQANLEKGETLRIQLVNLPSLDRTPNLLFGYENTDGACCDSTPVLPSEKLATVLLDGVPGTHFAVSLQRDSIGRDSVRWTPFPAHPQVLELSYADGDYQTTGLFLSFEDAVCEANQPPRPDCGL